MPVIIFRKERGLPVTDRMIFWKPLRPLKTLDAALTDIDLSIGTSAKKRRSRHEPYDVEQLGGLISSKTGTLQSVALVFGSEEHGLTKEQLKKCDIVSSVPLAIKYPSLNLAQAILIYAYELSSLKLELIKVGDEEIGRTEQKAVKEKAIEILDRLEVNRQPNLYQRLTDRLMTAGAGDIRLMLSLIKFIEKKL